MRQSFSRRIIALNKGSEVQTIGIENRLQQMIMAFDKIVGYIRNNYIIRTVIGAEADLNSAGWFLFVPLKILRIKLHRSHFVIRLSAQRIASQPTDHQALITQSIDPIGKVKRRSPQDSAVRKNVPQEFAKSNYFP